MRHSAFCLIPQWRLPMANKNIEGRRILITGASSGIGRAAALQLAEQGARLILLARREQALRALVAEIREAGGDACHYAVDLCDFDALDVVAAKVIDEHGGVDVLINNAGRSIRRPVKQSLDRFHDFERCMQINYFAPVRLVLKLLPGMSSRGDGQIINVLTWGTLLPSPKFAAYVASKCALGAFSQSLASEYAQDGIAVTTVHYPLVHTPMSAPTKHYSKIPGMSPEEAGEWLVRAVSKRPARLAPGFALVSGLNAYLFPKIAQSIAGRLPV